MLGKSSFTVVMAWHGMAWLGIITGSAHNLLQQIHIIIQLLYFEILSYNTFHISGWYAFVANAFEFYDSDSYGGCGRDSIV